MIRALSPPQSAGSDQALLRAAQLAVRYKNGALGISDVSLEIRPGEVVALFGANGAGKTTTVRAITGFLKSEGVRVVRGHVNVAGVDVTNWEPHQLVKRGVMVLPDRDKIFPNLTVRDNLKAVGPHGRGLGRGDYSEQVLGLFPALTSRVGELAGRLSGGQRQMLALARALMCAPRVLVVDEMTLGLHPHVQQVLFHSIRDIAANGTSVLIVDESAQSALDVADRWYFLENGQVRGSGSADARSATELAASAQLDGPTEQSARLVTADSPVDRAEPDVILGIHDLSVSFGGLRALDHVSLSVTEGEVLAIVGPNGSGKTTLLNAISRQNRGGRATGSIMIGSPGREALSALDVAKNGVGRSFQDPYLIDGCTVLENVLCGAHHQRRKATMDSIARILEMSGLLRLANEPAGRLPYGVKKRVDVARALAGRPRIVLLDEPASGLDRAERLRLAELIKALHELADVTIVLVEHDMTLVRSVATRVVGMQAGKVLAIGTAEEVLDSPEYQEAITGGDRGGGHASVTGESTSDEA